MNTENKIDINSENYFDVAEALHCYLSLNHNGQWSDEYRMLCQSKFKPSPMWSESRCLEENFYCEEITQDNCETVFNDLEQFMKELLNDK